MTSAENFEFMVRAIGFMARAIYDETRGRLAMVMAGWLPRFGAGVLRQPDRLSALAPNR